MKKQQKRLEKQKQREQKRLERLKRRQESGEKRLAPDEKKIGETVDAGKRESEKKEKRKSE